MTNHILEFNRSWEEKVPIQLNLLNLKKTVLIFRAVNHKLRQQILKMIDEHGKITVTELYVKLRLEQPVASQHLSVLRKASFVKAQRDGKFIYYSVNYSRIEQLNALMDNLLS